VTFIGLDPAPESDAASRAINALLGTADGDVLMTDADHLIAFGLAGDDNMVSTVEGSKLFGGDGGDLMQSEHGGDTLSGGEGVDMFMLWVARSVPRARSSISPQTTCSSSSAAATSRGTDLRS
jgi:hypothetical protein